MLQVNHLSCVRQQKEIFTDISFELAASDILLIQGENGSGKSSLLRLIAGLATPEHGDICWRGQTIQTTSYRSELHYLGHLNGIKLGLTVLENLQLAARLADTSLEKIKTCLDDLQLSNDQHTLTRYLSAGQKRRVALAKLFLIPKLFWILDEPFTSLDDKTQKYFLSQLDSHLKNGGMSIISSHHALQLANDRRMKIMRLGP